MVYTSWDDSFDELCGASMTCCETQPEVDSGVRDWLYGTEGAGLMADSHPEVPTPGAPQSLLRLL